MKLTWYTLNADYHLFFKNHRNRINGKRIDPFYWGNIKKNDKSIR